MELNPLCNILVAENSDHIADKLTPMTINTESAQTAATTIMMTNNSTADQSLTHVFKRF
jgi:hypothetical protein